MRNEAARKRTTTNDLQNKVMSAAVYVLRRQIINLIYDAKRLVPTLPRIEVRVTDNHERTLGRAIMHGHVIWITEEVVANRTIVFHEILHAAFGTPHVNGCPLMDPQPDVNMSDAQCDKLFLKYASKKVKK